MARRKCKILSREEERQMRDEIYTRLDLQRVLSEHSGPVLEMELGIHAGAIARMRQKPGLPVHIPMGKERAYAEARRRLDIWRKAKALSELYTVSAIAERYGCSVSLVCNRIREVKRLRLPVTRRAA